MFCFFFSFTATNGGNVEYENIHFKMSSFFLLQSRHCFLFAISFFVLFSFTLHTLHTCDYADRFQQIAIIFNLIKLIHQFSLR